MLLLVTDYFTSITECQLEYSLHLFGGWCPCCDVCHHWQYSETVSYIFFRQPLPSLPEFVDFLLTGLEWFLGDI